MNGNCYPYYQSFGNYSTTNAAQAQRQRTFLPPGPQQSPAAPQYTQQHQQPFNQLPSQQHQWHFPQATPLLVSYQAPLSQPGYLPAPHQPSEFLHQNAQTWAQQAQQTSYEAVPATYSQESQSFYQPRNASAYDQNLPQPHLNHSELNTSPPQAHNRPTAIAFGHQIFSQSPHNTTPAIESPAPTAQTTRCISSTRSPAQLPREAFGDRQQLLLSIQALEAPFLNDQGHRRAIQGSNPAEALAHGHEALRVPSADAEAHQIIHSPRSTVPHCTSHLRDPPRMNLDSSPRFQPAPYRDNNSNQPTTQQPRLDETRLNRELDAEELQIWHTSGSHAGALLLFHHADQTDDLREHLEAHPGFSEQLRVRRYLRRMRIE